MIIDDEAINSRPNLSKSVLPVTLGVVPIEVINNILGDYSFKIFAMAIGMLIGSY